MKTNLLLINSFFFVTRCGGSRSALVRRTTDPDTLSIGFTTIPSQSRPLGFWVFQRSRARSEWIFYLFSLHTKK